METKFSKFLYRIEHYLKLRKQLLVLSAIEKTGNIFSGMLSMLILLFMGILTFIFISIALALYISHLYGAAYIGFAAVSVLYLLIVMLFYIKRDKWIKTPFMNEFVRNACKDQDYE